jgi:predicted CXXCH cytochrome family protein
MEVDVTILTRRGAAVMRRSQRASGPRIGLGRGTDNAVPLADIRVGLHIAELVPRDGGIAIEKLGSSPLIVNGESVESAALKVGDEILLGPYRIEILAAPEGCDGAIQIELTTPIGAALERLTSGARIGLDRAGVGKRVYAWSGFVLIAVVCLAVPIFFFSGGLMKPWHKDAPVTGAPKLVGLSWNAGSFSNAHRFFAANCATCHQGAFTQIADKACLQCHSQIGSHVIQHVKLGSVGDELVSLNCVDCHSEHRGIEGSVIREGHLCLGCHRSLNEKAPDTGVHDIGGWPNGHPQFRATLVADAAKGTTTRAELGTNPPPMDNPGLKFSHAAHLVKGGFPVLHYKEMTCADCHVPDAGGQGFQPITYKDRCESCHQLTFDNVALPWPDAKVPHGDDVGVVATVWNYYAGLAVQGGTTASATPTTPPIERRGAGMPAPPASTPSAPPPNNTEGWVTAKSKAALQFIFDDKRGCAYCHYSTSADGAWDADKILANALPPKANAAHFVMRPMLRNRFLPQAYFDHSSHRGINCEDCHAARTAQTSSEVLIPGIDTCTKCHGGENASLQAQSTCISCHYFHRTDFGLMHMTAETVQ